MWSMVLVFLFVSMLRISVIGWLCVSVCNVFVMGVVVLGLWVLLIYSLLLLGRCDSSGLVDRCCMWVG